PREARSMNSARRLHTTTLRCSSGTGPSEFGDREGEHEGYPRAARRAGHGYWIHTDDGGDGEHNQDFDDGCLERVQVEPLAHGVDGEASSCCAGGLDTTPHDIQQPLLAGL